MDRRLQPPTLRSIEVESAQSLDLMTLVGLFGALQAAVLSVAVASLGGESKRPSRALALILACLAVALGSVSIQNGNLVDNMLPWILAEASVPFVFAPMVLYYASVVLGRRVRPALWIHLLPGVLFASYLLAFTIDVQVFGMQRLPRWLPPIQAVMVYMMAYTGWVAALTWRAGAPKRALHSHLHLLRVLVVILVGVHAAQIVRFVFRDSEAFSNIVPISGTAGAYVISILALRRSWLFAGGRGSRPRPSGDPSTTPDAEERIERRLLQLLEEQKPFLNESMSLAELASRLGVSRSELSRIVNSRLGVNFTTLISRYRVAEATRLLKDPGFDHLTIDAIGYEAGFGSRSAFYGAYKQANGETPSQTRRSRS